MSQKTLVHIPANSKHINISSVVNKLAAGNKMCQQYGLQRILYHFNVSSDASAYEVNRLLFKLLVCLRDVQRCNNFFIWFYKSNNRSNKSNILLNQ